jgi:transglutaminase-like putative cysteine protease
MRLRIAHTTTYRYEPPASGVIQVLRMTPGSHDGQYVAEWQIDVSTDSRLDLHEDAYGNVTHVLTHGPISDLTINVEGLVETQDTGGVLKGTDERFPPSFFLRATPLTEINPVMASFARALDPSSEANVLGFLHALMMAINEHMTFDGDPTNTGTSAIEAFAGKRGVCQDYAHIFIACTTDAHARVAIGLDYLGAAPVRGTRYGGGMETLTVSVKVDQAGRQGQWQSQGQS